MTRVTDFFAAHRILTSRVFSIVFFLAILLSESNLEGRLITPALFLLGLVLVGIATVGRLWCSLYISGYKNAELVMAGPYSISRNPLYFFSFLGFIGLGFATETVTFPLALAIVFGIAYPVIIAREEQYLRTKFGDAFTAYAARTPRFFPRFSGLVEPESWGVNPRLFRRTMGDVLWFVWLVGVIELVEALHEYHIVEPLFALP